MALNAIPQDDQLLTPSEVAQLFRVNPKTITRWARAGKLSATRTLGGHRRFRRGDIDAILARGRQDATVEVTF
jgi:excisionase family DNA binding protein